MEVVDSDDLIDLRKKERNVIYLRLRPEILSSKIDLFKQIFDREISKGTTNLLVDLGGLEIIFSVHIGNMIFYWKRFKKLGGDMKLCCANNQVRAVLERSGIFNVVPFFDTESDALNSFPQK